MSKLIAFVGSPRKQANTYTLVNKMVEEIKDAEYLILASPVYIHQISGLLKNTIDRFYPLTNHKHKPRFGIKKAIFIYSQGAPIPLIFNKYFRYFEKSLKAMGIKPYKRLVMKGAFVKDAASKNQKMLDKAYKIGNSLVIHEIGGAR